MILVDSESIAAIDYDAEEQQLYVRFRASGRTYVYYDVEEPVFQDLMLSESKGAFFNSRIRPHYRFAESGRTLAGSP